MMTPIVEKVFAECRLSSDPIYSTCVFVLKSKFIFHTVYRKLNILKTLYNYNKKKYSRVVLTLIQIIFEFLMSRGA